MLHRQLWREALTEAKQSEHATVAFAPDSLAAFRATNELRHCAWAVSSMGTHSEWNTE